MRAEAGAAEFVAFFADGWNSPKPDGFVSHFLPRMDPEVRLVAPLSPVSRGPEGFERFARTLFALFPDYHVAVEDWAEEGNAVYIRVTHSATIGRRPRTWDGIDRIVLRDGLVAERTAYFDPATLVAASLRSPSVWPRMGRWAVASRR